MHRPRTQILLFLALILAGIPAGAETPKPATTPAAEKPYKNTLRWQTNDVDSRGFDVYRGDSESGPFVKLTAQPLDGRVRGPKGEFAYVDDTIEPGKVYWYYVEVTDLRGRQRKFTPVMKAPAKGPAASPSPKP